MESLLNRVERVAVEEIGSYPDNPRIGNISALRASLEANKQFSPLVVQRSTGYILQGNHTYAAAKLLGWEQIDVVYVDVGDTEAKRIVLASNRIADLGSYNDAMLANLLQELVDDDASLLQGTGYEKDDVDGLLDATVTDIDIPVDVDGSEREATRAAIDRLFPVTNQQEASLDSGQPNLHPSTKAEVEAEAATGAPPLTPDADMLHEIQPTVINEPAPPVPEFVLFRFGDLKAKVMKDEYDAWRTACDDTDPFSVTCDYLESIGLTPESIRPFETDGPETWHS